MYYYIFLLISFALLVYGFIVFWTDRIHFSFLYPNYWIFLIRPWKLISFFLGTILINLVIYLSFLSTDFIFIDVYLATLICALTFVFSPWCVGFIYRYFKRKLYKTNKYLRRSWYYVSLSSFYSIGASGTRRGPSNQYFVALVIWLFITLMIYHFYMIMFYNYLTFVPYLTSWDYNLIGKLFFVKTYLAKKLTRTQLII